MTRFAKWIFLASVFTIFFTARAQATTYNAASCSQSDVAAAVAKAANGDTVIIPACSQTNWTTTLQVTKCISIEGQGQGTTVLGDNVPKNGYDTSVLILFNVNCSTGSIDLGNLTIIGVASDPNIYNKGHLRFLGTVQSFRFHHITMSNPLTAFLTINTSSGGLIDHLTEPNCGNGAAGNGEINIKASSWGGENYGDGSWAASDAGIPGSPNAVYLEDSDFTCNNSPYITNLFDGNSGARFVVRFNKITSGNTTSHGTDSSQRERSIRWQEVYKNSYSYDSAESPAFLAWIRGGSGVVWGNQVSAPGGLTEVLQATNLRDGTSYTPWGQCNGFSVYDLNLISSGYRCVDQPGSGQSKNLSGLLSLLSQSVGNSSLPFYVYLNQKGGSEFDNTSTSSNVSLNRDGYVYTSGFNGTSGVGSGPLGSRPSSCTTGVAYWATDQGSWWSGQGASGQLYKCTATNTWSLYYTPYTYPHPLQAGGGISAGSGTQISAPTNLTATVQ